jgi:hypothetical protein
MEPVVAIGGDQRQINREPKPRKQAKYVAVGCDGCLRRFMVRRRSTVRVLQRASPRSVKESVDRARRQPGHQSASSKAIATASSSDIARSSASNRSSRSPSKDHAVVQGADSEHRGKRSRRNPGREARPRRLQVQRGVTRMATRLYQQASQHTMLLGSSHGTSVKPSTP